MRLGLICTPITGGVPCNFDPVWEEVEPTSLPPCQNWRDQYVSCLDVTPFTGFEACIDDTHETNAASGLKPCLGLRFNDRILGQWRFDRKIILCDGLSHVLYNGKLGDVPWVFLKESASHGDGTSKTSAGCVAVKGTLEWWTGPRGAAVSRAPN